LTTKVHLAVDGRGLPLSIVLMPGNVNDCTAFGQVLAAITVPRPGSGRPRCRPDPDPSGYGRPALTKTVRAYNAPAASGWAATDARVTTCGTFTRRLCSWRVSRPRRGGAAGARCPGHHATLLTRNYSVVRAADAAVCGRQARVIEARSADGSPAGHQPGAHAIRSAGGRLRQTRSLGDMNEAA
jgi:hypothetical protein